MEEDKTLLKREKRSGRYRVKLRHDVLLHYSNGLMRCACCGENLIEFLSIDHINGNGAEHRKTIVGGLYSWLKKNNYPLGFQVLCHNCNLAKGFYGHCPHQNPLSKYIPPQQQGQRPVKRAMQVNLVSLEALPQGLADPKLTPEEQFAINEALSTLTAIELLVVSERMADVSFGTIAKEMRRRKMTVWQIYKTAIEKLRIMLSS